MKLMFSIRSRDDLVRLREFIRENNPQAAQRVARLLKKSIQKLVEHPHIGRPLEELPECRELIVGSYVVRYRVRGELVEIIRIWHGRENRP